MNDLVQSVLLTRSVCVPVPRTEFIFLLSNLPGLQSVREVDGAKLLELLDEDVIGKVFEKLGLDVAIVLHGLRQLLGVEVDYFTHMMVRAGLARPTPASTCMELSAIGPFRGMAVVLLLDVCIKRGVGEVALAATALVCPPFVVILGPALVALLAQLPFSFEVAVIVAT